MDIFVKDFATYRTIKKATSVQNSLVVDSLDAEKSSVTASGTTVDIDDVGNWLIVDGLVYQISGVDPENNQTKLTLRHPIDAFSRPIELSAQPIGQTIGAFVADQLQSHWVAVDDPVYAVPYLIVSKLDTTGFVAPTVDDGGCFSLPDYCRLMRKSYRVSVSFSDAGSNLLCTIARVPDAARNVSFEDGRSSLKSISYGTSGYAKLTVHHDVKTGEKDADQNDIYIRETTNWYLSEDGSVSQSIPSRRASGEWGVLHLKDSPNVAEKVIEAFSQNRSGHKLEFWSVLDIAVDTKCTFVVRGKILKSYVSCKQKDSTSNHFYYKAGELATTVTEKLKGVLR